MLHIHFDYELALWQMLYLIISPKRVYRNIYHNKQTRNQWARDDPTFYAILVVLMISSSIIYGSLFGSGIAQTFRMVLYTIFVEFIACGLAIAFVNWSYVII
jgi:hypothetical protein